MVSFSSGKQVGSKPVDKLKVSNAFVQAGLSCLATLGMTFAILSTSTHSAEAQSRAQICRSLNAQLASLSSRSSGGGNSAQYRKYDNAMRKQQVQLSKTKRIAKRGRCTGFGVFNNKSSQCRRVVSSMRKMEANLRKLKNTRNRFAPRGASNSRQRSNILRRLERNRCRSNVSANTRQASAEQVTKPRRRTLLEQIFGVKTYRENGQRETGNGTNEENSIYTGTGTYRTLCVRKTDGYYFPISFSTVQDRFEQDQATCQAMCPSANVELYHHRMPTEDSEDMVNYRTGKPYSQEPFAFAYRKSVDLEQRCRFATENRVQSVELQKDPFSKTDSTPRVGTPVFREDPALSPDDHDIKNGYMSMAKAKSYLLDSNSSDKNREDDLIAENRQIRIVGPAFFPVQ